MNEEAEVEAHLAELNALQREMDSTPMSFFPSSHALRMGERYLELQQWFAARGIALGTTDQLDFYVLPAREQEEEKE